MSVTRDITRDKGRDVTRTSAVTFAVSHDYPSRPVPTRPISSGYAFLSSINHLLLHRSVTKWASFATAEAGAK